MDSIMLIQLFLLLIKPYMTIAQSDHVDHMYSEDNSEDSYYHNYGHVFYENGNHKPYLIFKGTDNYEDEAYNPFNPRLFNPKPKLTNIGINKKGESFSSYPSHTQFYPNCYDYRIISQNNNWLCYYLPYNPVNSGMQYIPYAPTNNKEDVITLPEFYWGIKTNQFFQDVSAQFNSPNAYFLRPNDIYYHNNSIPNKEQSSINVFNNKPNEGVKTDFNTNKCDIICKCRNVIKKSAPEDGIKTEIDDVNNRPPPEKAAIGTSKSSSTH